MSEYPEVLEDSYYNLEQAASKNAVDIVAFLVEHGTDVNATENERHPEGAIVRAVQNGATDVVSWMLAHGAKVNHVVDGRTRCFALTSAARKGNLEIVKLLVEHGADINAFWADETPLSHALNYGQTEIAEYLRSKGALEPWQILGQPPPSSADEIVDHLKQHLGLANPRVLQEIVPTDPSIKVREFATHDSTVLVTEGMSARPMQVPAGGEEFQYAELMLHLPQKWPIEGDEAGRPENFWPVQWLRRIAQYPHEHSTWLGGESTIISNGEPPKPLGPNTHMTCWLLLVAPEPLGRLRLHDGRVVRFYSMFPIHTSERDYEQQHGVAALVSLFEQRAVSYELDPTRQPVA